jgi:hypothetical protein
MLRRPAGSRKNRRVVGESTNEVHAFIITVSIEMGNIGRPGTGPLRTNDYCPIIYRSMPSNSTRRASSFTSYNGSGAGKSDVAYPAYLGYHRHCGLSTFTPYNLDDRTPGHS